MSSSQQSPSGGRAFETVLRLYEMGIRVAGSENERRAAEWIAGRFESAGLRNVRVEPFPCLTFARDSWSLEARLDGGWREIPCEPAAHSPAAPTLFEAPLVYTESVPASPSVCESRFGGVAVLIYTSLLFQSSVLKRVMAARPAALLVVDDRFPDNTPVSVGFPRYWIDFLTCPVIGVPFAHAWELVRNRCESVRLGASASTAPAESQNVYAEIPGTVRPDEVLLISAHHDTVANNPGADDNGTGVASIIELAGRFSARPLERTLRFVSFGAEEQLSEGALHCALNLPADHGIQFVLNIDSVGAWMGRTGVYFTGPAALKNHIRAASRETGFPAAVQDELSPFSDHFPFNIRGIPTAWYYRTTCAAARHFHHSPLETPGVVSPDVLEQTLLHQSELLKRLAADGHLSTPWRIPGGKMNAVRKLAEEWCGGERVGRVFGV